MKKRILALILAVLMIVSVLPMTVFALDSELPAVPEEDYTGEAFGKKDVEGLVKSDNAYWQAIPYQTGSVDPTGRTVSGSRLFTYRSGVTVYNDNTGVVENVWKKNEAGLDVLMDMSFKLDNSKTGSMLIGVLHHIRGGITLLDARSYGDGTAELYYYNSENSGATEKKLCDLPADKYTRVQVLLDVGGTSVSDDSNTVYVFLDGKLAVTDKFLADGNVNSEYNFFANYASVDKGYAKGFLLSGYFFNPNSTAAVIDIEKFTPYYYDTDANGIVSDTPREQLIVQQSAVNEKFLNALYSSDNSYWQKMNVSPDASGNTVSNSNYRWFAVRDGLTAFNDSAGLTSNVWKKNLAGLDTAMDMSIKLDNSKSGTMLIGLLHYYKGGITLLEARSYGNGRAELYYTNTENGGATERKLSDLPADKYTRVQILLDVGGTSAENEANTVYVFIDGALVMSDTFLASGTITNEYKLFTSNDYAKGFMASGYFFNPNSSAAVIDVEHVAMYLYDDDADGDVTDSSRSTPVMHFNDFENEATGTEYAAGSTFAGSYAGLSSSSSTSHAVKIFSEGGNKAIYTDASGDTYYQLRGQNVKGADFILSYDVKLKNATTSNGSMFWAASTGTVAWNLTPISTRADGSIYINKEYMLTQCFNGTFGNTKVGQLSTERYTNITIVFGVSTNTYRVYIDGVDTMGDMPMLDSTTAAKYGDEGFYLTQIRMQYRNYYLDNIALYYGDTYYNEINSGELLNGYKKNDNKLYYYENGLPVANKNLDQNIVVTDENGAVKVGDTYPAALNTIYTYIGNGDRVLVDGLYEGFYKIGSNTYYYGNKNRVTGVTTPYFAGDNAYTFDVYGVANVVNGIYSNKLYLDGVLQKNKIVEYDGDKYNAGSDGTFVGGVVKNGDEEWFFDPANGYKGEPFTATDAVVDMGTGKAYGSIEDMVANVAEGSTVKVYEDITSETELAIGNQVKLDLNGNTVTAPGMVLFGGTEIVDNAESRGVIDVPKGTLKFVGYSTSDLTVYYEENIGYKFASVKKQDNSENGVIAKNTDCDGFEFIFRPSLDDSTELNKTLFADGAYNDGMTFIVKLVNKNGETIRSFVYTDDVVKKAYAEDLAFKLTVRKLDPVKHGNIKVVYGIETETGMSCYIEAGICEIEKKKVSVLGDSISTYDGWSNNVEHNSTMGNNFIFYSATNPYKPGADFPVENTWWHKVTHNLEFEFCVNNSVSGSRVNMEATHITRPQNLHNTTTGDTPDIILIYIGINDWAASVPLGLYDGTGELPETLTTFSEMYANIIKQAREAYPDVEIYCCTLLPEKSRGTDGVNGAGVSIKQYNDVIATIAVNMGATVIDLYEESGITFGNLSEYTLDMLHPNVDGMKLISDTVLDVISTNMKKKTLSILGDSISTYSGTVPEGNRTYYGPDGEYGYLATNDVTDVSYMWWHQLMVEKNYKLEVNQSYSSSPVSNVGFNGNDASGYSFINRMKNIGDPDVIVIYGGTNDALGAAEVGEYKYENWTADDLKTFRPAYAYMLDYLTKNHPNADIVVIIQPNLDDRKVGIADSIKEICNYYDVKYVELPETLELHDASGTNAHPSKLGMQQIFETIKDYFN